MTEIQSEAIMLKKQVFREQDLFVDLLLQKKGLIKAIAFGAASNRSSRGRRCQPFKRLSIYLKKTKHNASQKESYSILEINELAEGELLSTAQIASSTHTTITDTIFACANYINECYLHLAAQFEKPKRAYNLYVQTVQQLTQAQDMLHINQILRYFELEILCFLGYDIRHNPKEDKTAHYYYDLQTGWQKSNESTGLHWQSCQNLENLQAIDKQQLQCLKQHNQRLLNELSHFKIEASRDWLKKQHLSTHYSATP
jgi:recombinational DNA repair protein (RecF pathway)